MLKWISIYQWVFKCLRKYPYNLQTESLFIIKNFNRIAINLKHCWHSFSPILHQIKCLSNKGKQSAIEWRWITHLEQIFIKRVQPRPQSTHLAFPLTSLDIYHIPWNKMQIFIIGTYKETCILDPSNNTSIHEICIKILMILECF